MSIDDKSGIRPKVCRCKRFLLMLWLLLSTFLKKGQETPNAKQTFSHIHSFIHSLFSNAKSDKTINQVIHKISRLLNKYAAIDAKTRCTDLSII